MSGWLTHLLERSKKKELTNSQDSFNMTLISMIMELPIGINGSTPTSTGTIPDSDIEYEELLLVFGGVSIIVLVIILSKLKK